MKFEWDPRKAALNFVKHRVSFEEATTAFRDPQSTSAADPDHSADEDRFIAVGLSSGGRMLAVSFTGRKDSIRIISARRATKDEREIYEKGQIRT